MCDLPSRHRPKVVNVFNAVSLENLDSSLATKSTLTIEKRTILPECFEMLGDLINWNIRGSFEVASCKFVGFTDIYQLCTRVDHFPSLIDRHQLRRSSQ